ncbi:MAG: transcription antitermination factor NusB [Candidatus Heritagella sp.]|nr:transcription antitermination factor NusB [Candidatus Heritagella sp.]
MKRSEAREQAFQLVFEMGITGDSVDATIDAAGMSRDLILDDFAEKLAKGVEQNREKIDEQISRYIRGWKFSRLSRVAVAALRLAVYEILYEDNIPDSVSINEAVELAKKYGSVEDAPFVNGVLASVVKSRGEDRE